jgi:hypothetical protein
MLAAVAASVAACSSSTAGQGSNAGGVGAGSSGVSAPASSGSAAPTSGGVATVTTTAGGSATGSGTSTASGGSGSGSGGSSNWPASVNFGALPHPDMHCAGAGEGGKVDVLKVVTADVTGDGIPEAIVRMECRHSASEWPDTVQVYSKTGSTPTSIGTLLAPAASSYATGISASGSTVTLHTTTWSSFAPGCCPDLLYVQRFTWTGSSFAAGPRQDVLHPCGDTAIVTTSGGQQGATGHSAVVILFRNRLPQPCTLRGYPGLDAMSASGHVLAHATRTLSGFAGGASSIATITIAPGHRASATAEWLNAASGGQACTTGASAEVTPPNTSATVTLSITPTVCGLQIHPTVAGTSGRS